MIHLIRMFFGFLAAIIHAACRSRQDLVLENAALRQQLAVFANKKPRPHLRLADRVFWIALRQIWSRWKDVLILVKPETVVKWHRMGFRLYWRWKSTTKRPGRPRIQREVRDLIRRFALENGWGAPRIHGELLKLGFQVDERTVSRYMPKRPPPPEARKRWLVFLRNHRDCLAGMDFFTVPTITFQVLYVFFIIHHARRNIVHFAVSDHPHAEWIVQQLREAFPFDTAPRYLIFDRDGKYGNATPAALRKMGIEPVRTAYRCPWQNPVAERVVGSLRRDLLDHVIVFNEHHLRRLISSYLDYYHNDRCHLGLDKDTPCGRPVTPRPAADAKVVGIPRIGGLHHRYEWRLAA